MPCAQSTLGPVDNTCQAHPSLLTPQPHLRAVASVTLNPLPDSPTRVQKQLKPHLTQDQNVPQHGLPRLWTEAGPTFLCSGITCHPHIPLS